MIAGSKEEENQERATDCHIYLLEHFVRTQHTNNLKLHTCSTSGFLYQDTSLLIGGPVGLRAGRGSCSFSHSFPGRFCVLLGCSPARRIVASLRYGAGSNEASERGAEIVDCVVRDV